MLGIHMVETEVGGAGVSVVFIVVSGSRGSASC